MAETGNHCAHCAHNGERTKERSEKEFKSLMNRLKRIEGQIRGIEGMLEKNAYCPDILIQVSSVTSALNSFNKELLASHVREDMELLADEVYEVREGRVTLRATEKIPPKGGPS